MNDAKGLECTCLHFHTTWIFSLSSCPYSRLFLGALMFNASFSPSGEVSPSQICHGLQTPSQWLLIWVDCFALGRQGSFILDAANDGAKSLMWAEIQLPRFWGEEQGGTQSLLMLSFSTAPKLPGCCSKMIWIFTPPSRLFLYQWLLQTESITSKGKQLENRHGWTWCQILR